MRLSYAFELIAVLAVGLAMERWHSLSPGYAAGFAGNDRAIWLKEDAEAFFAGAAVAGCLGLWIEVASRRSPRPWGVGRWAWSVAGIYLIVRHIARLAHGVIPYLRLKQPLTGFLMDLPDDFRMTFGAGLLDSGACVLLALVASRWGSGRGDGRADAREWTGRAFAAGIIVGAITAELLIAFIF